MINLRLAGGLGNQLFQICSALRYCNNQHNQIRLYLAQLGSYDVPRTYELEKLLTLKFENCIGLPAKILWSRLPRLLAVNGLFINDNNYTIKSKKLLLNNIFMDGYFQFEQTWETFFYSYQYLKRNLSPFFKSKQKAGLVVHARGGDFLKDLNSHDHLIDFYQNVLKLKKISKFSNGYLCCSDPNYAKNILEYFENNGIKLTYQPFNDTNWEEDFVRLLNAKFIIGSRSTFAWWASLFGETECVFPSDFKIGQPRKLYHPWEFQSC